MANIYNNYSISSSKGKLYLKSDKPQEGYVAVPYGTEGKISYHKYENRIEGVLTKAEVKEVNPKLSFFEVTLVDGNTINRVSAPLKNSKGNYNDEVKSMVSALNNAKIGEEVTISIGTKSIEKGGKTYDNLTFYINYVNELNEDGKGLSTGYIPYTEIPRAIKEEDEDLGTTWDWKPVNKYYAQKIREIVERFKTFAGQSSTTPPSSPAANSTPKPSKPKEKVAAGMDDEEREAFLKSDDLPF